MTTTFDQAREDMQAHAEAHLRAEEEAQRRRHPKMVYFANVKCAVPVDGFALGVAPIGFEENPKCDLLLESTHLPGERTWTLGHYNSEEEAIEALKNILRYVHAQSYGTNPFITVEIPVGE